MRTEPERSNEPVPKITEKRNRFLTDLRTAFSGPLKAVEMKLQGDEDRLKRLKRLRRRLEKSSSSKRSFDRYIGKSARSLLEVLLKRALGLKNEDLGLKNEDNVLRGLYRDLCSKFDDLVIDYTAKKLSPYKKNETFSVSVDDFIKSIKEEKKTYKNGIKLLRFLRRKSQEGRMRVIKEGYHAIDPGSPGKGCLYVDRGLFLHPISSQTEDENGFDVYVLNEGNLLGEGSFGTVKAVTDKIRVRPGASSFSIRMDSDAWVIKEIKPCDWFTPWRRASYKKEAEIASAVGLPTQLINLRREKYAGRFFLLMSRVPGVSLKKASEEIEKIFKDDPWLALLIILEIACQLIANLKNIHEKGYFHCDINPSNVMVLLEEFFPEARIIDFGLSMKKSDADVSSVGVGTPGFRAPEIELNKQYNKNFPYTEKSDSYSLAVTIAWVFLYCFDPKYARDFISSKNTPRPFRFKDIFCDDRGDAIEAFADKLGKILAQAGDYYSERRLTLEQLLYGFNMLHDEAGAKWKLAGDHQTGEKKEFDGDSQCPSFNHS